MTGRRATDGLEPRQVRKEAAIRDAVCVVDRSRSCFGSDFSDQLDGGCTTISSPLSADLLFVVLAPLKIPLTRHIACFIRPSVFRLIRIRPGVSFRVCAAPSSRTRQSHHGRGQHPMYLSNLSDLHLIIYRQRRLDWSLTSHHLVLFFINFADPVGANSLYFKRSNGPGAHRPRR